jgi:hypothetical protein
MKLARLEAEVMQDSVKVFYYCKKLHPICSGSDEEKLRLPWKSAITVSGQTL